MGELSLRREISMVLAFKPKVVYLIVMVVLEQIFGS
jgi:hypothetical protein